MRKTLRILYLLFFFLLVGAQLNAQKLTLKNLTVKDGLSQNTVMGIVKDKQGFMWFGTWNGLCRFDGYNFKVYNTIPGDSTSIANNRIHYIYKDRKGTLWIATFDSFVCRYNYLTDNFTRFKADKLPRAIRDSTSRQRFLQKFGNYSDLLRGYNSEFEITTTKDYALFRIKGNKSGVIKDDLIYSIYKDEHGILWLGTATQGVIKADLNPKRFHSVSLSADNPTAMNRPVRAIWANESEVWLGTQENGLIFINPQTKVQKQIKEGPLDKFVRSIFKDSSGNLWIGYRYGLDKYDGRTKKFTNYFREGAGLDPTNYRFFSGAEDPVDGSIWFGTFNSILRHDLKTKEFKKQHFGKYFNSSNAVSLFFDSKSNLWIGTEYAGIIHLKRNAKNKGWTDTVSYTINFGKSKLPDNRVYSITEDEFGYIWAGTTNGLCRIDPGSGKIKIFTKQEGLSDQYICKVLSDKKGHIWISHKKGLSKLTIKTGAIRNYTIIENASGNEFVDGSGYLDKATGKMYFGGTDGFVSFHPDEIHDNSYHPLLVLTELQVLNKLVLVGQQVNGRVILPTPINKARKIVLTHEDRSFSIGFATLNYTDPERNQYAYKMEGLDKNWVHTDASRRVATYSNLSDGKYTFKVKASNSDGVWNSTPSTLEIIVLPPWWKTWWAYLFYISIALFGVYLIYRIVRARNDYNHQILSERLKAEKSLELDQLKSRFFTNISHEFRTPLTLIMDPLEVLLSAKQPDDKVKDYYQIMHRNARRLLALTNQFIDFQKVERGMIKVQVLKQDMVVFIRNIMDAFVFQAEQRKIRLIFKTDISVLETGFDPDIVEKILYNLISNAFKFTSEGGEIKVLLSLDVDSKNILIDVTDNGSGIPTELLEKIFEPFYQVEGTQSQLGGSGVGLALVKELVSLHKGNIKVSSKPDIETRFSVSLRDLSETDSPFEGGKDQIGQDAFSIESDTSIQPAPHADAPLVLIIEDNYDVRSYLKINLSSAYKIIEAEDGTVGLKLALETIPDLIISDVMMPGLSGIELCQKVKSDERTSHIPVILLTARQSDSYQIEGYETGADAYISKPFSTALLIVRINNLIESRKRLRELFNKSTGFNVNLLGTNAADKAFLAKVTKLIEDNHSMEDYSVEWMASQLFLSRSQLYRKMKALTNQSVHDFVTTIRLKKASELLLQGELQVSEVAYMVGYSDSTSFSRSFQRQFGQTPKKFSQQGRNSLSSTK